jgi:hypothetical protein
MKRLRFLLAVVLIALVFEFSGCRQPFAVTGGMIDTVYKVAFPETEHGLVMVAPESGISGTEIKLMIFPNPGYVLERNSLQWHTWGPINIGTSSFEIIDPELARFDLPSNNVYISAVFVKAPEGTHTVSAGAFDHGHITAYPISGTPGTEINLRITADSGYGLKSLVYTDVQGGNSVTIYPPYKFNLPPYHVVIQAEFEAKDVSGLIESARTAMDAGDYDAAFDYYEAAWRGDPHNTEAAVYASLGRLGAIAKDPKARSVARKINMKYIPGNLNDWIDGDLWLYEYKSYDEEDGHYIKTVKLPILNDPAGFLGGFLNFEVVHANKDGDARPTTKLFFIYLFWNLISSNPEGFNDILDDFLGYVLGPAFEEAEDRLDSIAGYNQTVLLNNRLKADLNLDNLFGLGDTYIGKAELEALFASLRFLKAAMEWLVAYDWRMDMTILRVPAVNNGDGVNEIMSTVLTHPGSPFLSVLYKAANNSPLSGILPFRTGFMKDRRNGMMSRARTDLSRAVNDFIAASNYLEPNAKNKLTNTAEYQWILDACKALQEALNSGRNFYFPAVLPEKGAPWVTQSNAEYGINIDKAFIPGALSIDKLMITEDGGSTPVFYGFTGNDGTGTGTPVTEKSGLDQYNSFGFELNKSNLDQIIVKGLEGKKWAHAQFPELLLTRENGSLLWEYYQKW